ncbi:hypothetical protein KSP40_PGU001498 [Platanthera guangdongensis]|uniref:Rubisco LSMT substrate-binding domain-containing protein n=1 Tax=Platanthera guangdongensis TaxID=2320717 RepID=A0ABR2MJN5_9ASPA
MLDYGFTVPHNIYDQVNNFEVKTSCRKGRGIPQALRAFARVTTVLTCDELTTMANEATQSDGRLARWPLKDTFREIQAHNILLSEFVQMMKCRDAKIEELESSNVPYCSSQFWCRRQMAIDLFRGEIRVLKSASAWVTNYCQSLSALS